MTSNHDEAMQWLARSLGWERSLERLRHSVLADAAAAGSPELPADEPLAGLEPAAGSEPAVPEGEPASRPHGRRRSEIHRGARARGAGVVVGGEGTPAGARRSA